MDHVAKIFVKTKPMEYIDIKNFKSDETELFNEEPYDVKNGEMELFIKEERDEIELSIKEEPYEVSEMESFIKEEPYVFSPIETLESVSFNSEPNSDPLLINKSNVCSVSEKVDSEVKQLPDLSGEGGLMKVFKCVFCDYVCRESTSVESHALNSHSLTYFCRKCKHVFSSKSQMFAHELKESCVEQKYFMEIHQCIFCGTADEKLSCNCDVSCKAIKENTSIDGTYDKSLVLPLVSPVENTEKQLNTTITLNINGSFEHSDFTFTTPRVIIQVPSNCQSETLEIDSSDSSNNNEKNINSQLVLEESEEEIITFMRIKFNENFSGKNVIVFPRIYCRTCEKNFDVNFYIQSHLVDEINFTCKCPFCQKLPSKCTRKMFLSHFRDHCLAYVIGKLFHCPLPQCKYSFFSRQNLQYHKVTCEVARESDEKPVESVLELNIPKNYYSTVNFIKNKLCQNYPGKDLILYTTIFCNDCKIDYDVDLYIFRHILQRKQSFVECSCFICGWKLRNANVNDFLFHLQYHFIDSSYGKRMFFCNYPNCNAAFFTPANQKKHANIIHNVSEDINHKLNEQQMIAFIREKCESQVTGKNIFARIYCCTCKRNFDINFYIQSHLEENSKCSCLCPFCKIPTYNINVVEHIQNHFRYYNKLFNCTLDSCNYSFFSQDNLDYHKTTCCMSTNINEKPALSVLELNCLRNYYSVVKYVKKKLSLNSAGKEPILCPTIFCNECKTDYDVNLYISRHILQRKQSFITCSCFFCGWKDNDANVNDFLFHLQSHVLDTQNRERMFRCRYPHCATIFFTIANQKKHSDIIHSITSSRKPGDARLQNDVSIESRPNDVTRHEVVDSAEHVKNNNDLTYTTDSVVERLKQFKELQFTGTLSVTAKIFCMQCSEDTDLIDFIKNHVNQEHRFACPFCQRFRKMSSRHQWNEHFFKNHDGCSKKFNFCRECDCWFFNSYNFEIHFNRKHWIIGTNEPVTKKTKVDNQC